MMSQLDSLALREKAAPLRSYLGAHHDIGVHFFDELLKQLPATPTHADIETERAEHYRNKWQAAAASLRAVTAERDDARYHARSLASAWTDDCRPVSDSVQAGLSYAVDQRPAATAAADASSRALEEPIAARVTALEAQVRDRSQHIHACRRQADLQ